MAWLGVPSYMCVCLHVRNVSGGRTRLVTRDLRTSMQPPNLTNSVNNAQECLAGAASEHNRRTVAEAEVIREQLQKQTVLGSSQLR